MTIEIKPSICGICPGGCAVKVTLEDGRLVKVEQHKDAPYANLCIRGRHAPEIIYSPHRLKTPLIRTGERGEGKFRAASWDEALGLTAQKMTEIKAEYGPQAMFSYSGRGTFEQSMDRFYNNIPNTMTNKLLLPFGSPNISGVASLCYVTYGILAPMANFGLLATNLSPDLENSNLIVVWGTNPITDSPPFIFKRIVKAQQNKTKLIAVDQMRSDIATRADQWVGVRPGTDGALILGLLNVVINERLYDREFVEKWTVGFSELSDYVQNFNPQKVERFTRVPAETITALAREIANTEGVSLHAFTGLEYSNCGMQSIRALYILWAITGNLDVPGGLYLTAPRGRTPQDKFPKPAGILPVGAEKYPLFCELTGSAQFMEFPRAVLDEEPYPVKGLLVIGSSILTSYPQPKIFEEAFRKLDFMMVVDLVLTRDALFADVILPSATYYETNSYQRYPGYVRLRRRVIEPVGQSKNCAMIMTELAERFGYGHLFPQSEEELVEKAFAGNPALLKNLQNSCDGVKIPVPERCYKKYELGLLRSDKKPGFPTPSGLMEITSSLTAKHGYDALPVYTEPVEGPLHNPGLYRKFPLVLNTGARIQSTFRSQHLNVPGLVKFQEKPHALINPLDAAERGIKTGDKVAVSTRRGEVFFYADVTEDVLPGQVEVNMGGGNPTQVEAWRQANVNHLTDYSNRDPISGFPVFKALLCQVEKA